MCVFDRISICAGGCMINLSEMTTLNATVCPAGKGERGIEGGENERESE